MTEPTTTYDVRVWATTAKTGARGTTYRVRWAAGRRPRERSFTTKKLAESFRAQLLTAARKGEPFDTTTGLPVAALPKTTGPTWYEHARAFVAMKWPDSSPRHRKSTAEGLVTITLALTTTPPPHPDHLRAALLHHAYNAAPHQDTPTAEHAAALAWIEKHSRPLTDLADTDTLRHVLDTIARKLDGTPAAPSTTNRKRAALTSAIGYALERGHLDTNPMTRVRVKRRKTTEEVDTRTVVSHPQALALLAAVHEQYPTLEAFFGCIYYAAMRPAEVRNLRRTDLDLPGGDGWGTATLRGSYQDAGKDWTDDGSRSEERALKHRADRSTRRVPLAPPLVALLRAHLDTYGSGAEGRLFVMRVGPMGRPLAGPYGTPVTVSTAARVWSNSRAAAFRREGQTVLPRDPDRSPLARRPYDLRHACVSTWLAAGVPATQVAAWAGHSVNVLLTTYAKVIEGHEDDARRRITEALSM